MADSDSALYTLRYNQVSQKLEGQGGTPQWNSVTLTNSGEGLNQLTGDVTAGPGSGSQAATLANTAVTAGSYTAANITVDAKGRLTAAASGGAIYLPVAGGTMTGAINFPTSTNAAVTGTITPAAATGVTTYRYTITGVATLNGPASGVDGQKITFRLLQDVTGHSVTFATGSGNFRFGTDITSFTASGASLTDYVGAIWNAAASRWDIVSVVQGF